MTYSVIANITRGGSQMYYGSRFGTAYTKCVHVGHDVMSTLLLLRSRKFVVYICQVSFHFLYLFIGDIQSQYLQIKIVLLCRNPGALRKCVNCASKGQQMNKLYLLRFR